MTNVQQLVLRVLVAVQLLESTFVLGTNAKDSSSMTQGRRGFLAAAGSFAVAASLPPSEAEAAVPWGKPRMSEITYADFKTMLESDRLSQVEFGIDGYSLACLAKDGGYFILKDMPDDPPLLRELYQKDVIVSLQEMKFEKKMNAVNWFRELVGVGDDLTDEEKYEYRGYKTNRQNIPERSYVPANLITGYDLSRNMRK